MIFLVVNSWNKLSLVEEYNFNYDSAKLGNLDILFLYNKWKTIEENSNWLETFIKNYSGTDFSKTDINIYINSVEQFTYFKQNFETCSILIYYTDFEHDFKEEFKPYLNDFDYKCLVTTSTPEFYSKNFKEITLQN